jgi:hypothetical protein
VVDDWSQRGVGRGLDRTASAHRAPSVTDTRQEALLQRVGDVIVAHERSCTRPRAGDKLQRGLAEAVLEVLEAEAVTVHPQEDLALGGRHTCTGLSRIVAARRALSQHRRQGRRGQRDRGLPSLLLLRPRTHRRDNA